MSPNKGKPPADDFDSFDEPESDEDAFDYLDEDEAEDDGPSEKSGKEADDDDGDLELVLEGDDGEDDAADDDDGDGEESPQSAKDGLDGLPKSVRNRIMRANRQAEKAKKEAETYRAEVERERARAAKMTRMAVEANLESVENTRKAYVAQLREARDEGDFDKEQEISNKLADLKVHEATLKSSLDDTGGGASPSQQQNRDGESAGGRDQPANPHLNTWLSHNSWFNNPEFAAERGAAVEISNTVARDGYAPETKEHFEEVTKRLARKFPELKAANLDGRRYVAKGNRHRGRTGRGGDGSGQMRSGKSEVLTITPQEKRVYEEMGLDLKNPSVLKELQRERKAVARS